MLFLCVQISLARALYNEAMDSTTRIVRHSIFRSFSLVSRLPAFIQLFRDLMFLPTLC
jgi:hypothetical protein